MWKYCVKRWASSEERFLRYCVLKFEKHKIEETEKTASKVKSQVFHRNKAIKFKFAHQDPKNWLQIITNNSIGHNKVKTVCWRLFTAYFLVLYTLFCQFWYAFYIRKMQKAAFPIFFKILAKLLNLNIFQFCKKILIRNRLNFQKINVLKIWKNGF